MYSKLYYVKKIMFYLKTNKKYLYKRFISRFSKSDDKLCSFNSSVKLLGNDSVDIDYNNVVDIIVPVYNGYDFLTPLFLSIANNTKESLVRLIIIDDCSSDHRVAQLLNSFHYNFNGLSNSIILSNDSNMGFVRTVNKAYKYVNSKFFVILNTDVEVPKNWLQRLISPMIRDSGYVSATPWTNSGEIYSFPRWLKNNSLILGSDVNEVDQFFNKIDPKFSSVDVPTGIGFCMAIRKSIVDEIGFLDENTFSKGYGEENDWCMRAHKLGYKHAFVTNLFVYHKHGGSFSSKEKLLLLEQNSLKLIKKHPEFEELLFDFILADPLVCYRNIILSTILRSKFEPIIYFNLQQLENEIRRFVVQIESIKNYYSVRIKCCDFCISYKISTLSELNDFFEYYNLQNAKVISKYTNCTVVEDISKIIKSL